MKTACSGMMENLSSSVVKNSGDGLAQPIWPDTWRPSNSDKNGMRGRANSKVSEAQFDPA